MKKKYPNKKKQKECVNSNHPEVYGLTLLALGFIILLSLISFRDGNASSNWLGYLGYALSWMLHYTFGLGSYVISACLFYLGWKKFLNKELSMPYLKVLYAFMMLFSFCTLLNVVAELNPSFAYKFGKSVYSEIAHFKQPIPHITVRTYLGGVPFYFLYKDLPTFNLDRMLSNVGVILCFSTIFLVSLLLFTQVRIVPILQAIAHYIASIFEKKKHEDFLYFIKGLLKKYRSPSPSKRGDPMRAQALGIKTELRPKRKQMASSIRPSPLLELRRLKTSSISPLKEIVHADDPFLRPNTPMSIRTNPVQEKREKALKAQSVYNGDFEHYELPSPSLLTDPQRPHNPTLKRDLKKQAEILEETLLSFGIEAKVGEIHCGPTITSFEVHPAIGVKVQKIKTLENDIALNMEAKSIRIIAPIPGKAAVGIEIPTQHPQEVNLKEILRDFHRTSVSFELPILLGKAVNGENVMADLSKMPHCIIAGATGTGKSVCINVFVMSLLMNCKPNEVKLILIDPKKVELTPYTKLPHMLAPVITEPQGVIAALKWLVSEMEKRYDILKHLGVRNIHSFNKREINKDFEDSINLDIPKRMSYIVCFIDELADLMMMSSSEIEMPIARIAQMARAVGIHLVLATQRPSREVITGLIKANFPTRLSFKVASRVNSQIVLDEIGAEALLGNGDMLFMPPGAASLVRTQGCYIRDLDIQKVIKHITDQAPPNYLIDSFDVIGKEAQKSEEERKEDFPLDPLYQHALDLVERAGVISTTFIQRKLKVGYARAASIMDQLEDNGIISPPEGSKPRRLLMSPSKLSDNDTTSID